MATRTRRLVAVAVLAGALVGGGTVALATPTDPCAQYVNTSSNSVSGYENYRYLDCRLDRQDAALKRIEEKLGATPTQSPSASPSASASQTPSASPSASATPSQSQTPSASPSASQTPSSTPSASETAAGGTIVLGRSFPNADTTGVPAGTTLTPYTGPLTITTANTVIDSKTVTGELRIFAKGVVIKNSRINGKVYVDYNENKGSFTITDSEVKASDNWPDTGIGDAFFTATRVEVTGGSRSINCYAECTVKDSYVHGQYRDAKGVDHESGIRVNTNSHLIHNTISCDAEEVPPDAGCSAAITGYPDFDPVQGNVIENNLILPTTGGYCSYGGSTGGKPYSGQTKNITFKDNIYMRGTRLGQGGVRQCGYWGAITSFDVNAPGNVWSNNLWDDGTKVQPAN